MFLSNNVKFSCLNDVVTFIDNVRCESGSWKYSDFDILDYNKNIDITQCFEKIVMTCGYKYIPDEDDLDIIWKILQGCNQVELNRLFYKNNLYSFMENTICHNLMVQILTGLDRPYMEPMKPPKKIVEPLNYLRDLLLEYVFYNYQIIDRMDRNKNMVKNVSIISDTDSSFVSLDAWYNYNLQYLQGIDMPILHQSIDVVKYIEGLEKKFDVSYDPTNMKIAMKDIPVDEYGDPKDPHEFDAITFEDPELDYDFYNEEIIEAKRWTDPCTIIPQDGLRFSLINIMAYILDAVINRYMLDFTKQSHSYRGDDKCKIIMKNEFFMHRVLLTEVKKNYAALQMVQEGNFLGMDGVLDVKGIPCMTKSVTGEDTKKKLKKILLEDILKSDTISQMKVITDMAIFEKQIYTDLMSGSKKYYKPLTVKSAAHYDDPFGQQGIKGSIAWNYVKDKGMPGLDLSDRNSVNIAKVNITATSLEKIKNKYPEKYEKFMDLVDTNRYVITEGKPTREIFKGSITSIAIPVDAEVPEWLMDLVDFDTIVCDNLANFPLESIGVSKFDSKKTVTYSNVVKL